MKADFCEELKAIIDFNYEEQALPLFSNINLPVVSIIGDVVVEHIVEKVNNQNSIRTLAGGRSASVALFLKQLSLNSNYFTFLCKDEYLDIILQTLENQNISVTWGIRNVRNPACIRFIEERKEIESYMDFLTSVNPIFLEEFIYTSKILFFDCLKWNIDIIEFLSTKLNKQIFVDINTKRMKEFSSGCDFLFVNSESIEEGVLATKNASFNYSVIFTPKRILAGEKIIKIDNENMFYYEEAISAYESEFIKNIYQEQPIEISHQKALNIFLYAYKYGKIKKEA